MTAAERLARILSSVYGETATDARDREAMYLDTGRPHLAALYRGDARSDGQTSRVAFTIAEAARHERGAVA